jgi:hypothetical protein
VELFSPAPITQLTAHHVVLHQAAFKPTTTKGMKRTNDQITNPEQGVFGHNKGQAADPESGLNLGIKFGNKLFAQ